MVAPNGASFLADGHGPQTNACIVKFDKDGRVPQSRLREEIDRPTPATQPRAAAPDLPVVPANCWERVPISQTRSQRGLQ